jgi:hypothetical protein
MRSHTSLAPICPHYPTHPCGPHRARIHTGDAVAVHVHDMPRNHFAAPGCAGDRRTEANLPACDAFTANVEGQGKHVARKDVRPIAAAQVRDGKQRWGGASLTGINNNHRPRRFGAGTAHQNHKKPDGAAADKTSVHVRDEVHVSIATEVTRCDAVAAACGYGALHTQHRRQGPGCTHAIHQAGGRIEAWCRRNG